MPVDHYENFPVASLLLPRALRAPIEAIYRFARAADDLADEGDASPTERLAALAGFRAQLDVIAAGKTPVPPIFHDLAPIIRQYELPLACFYDLLDAFTQDVSKTRYADYAELLDYSRRSANPVGRLILALTRLDTPDNLRQSDAICSALQCINFWQDVAIDWQKGRAYLPLEDLHHFGVTEADLARYTATPEKNLPSPAFRELMAFEAARSRALMQSGQALAKRLPGRLGWEIRFTVQGGLRILEKLAAIDYDMFRRRPRLVFPDWFRMGFRSLIQ
ncbi:MAG: squalene synthase HpnC [Zoogloeaceae bacterium]|jgi:phytoene synthase|nr:squalene synthase HpnC [Zoogloeaceae bacterium]